MVVREYIFKATYTQGRQFASGIGNIGVYHNDLELTESSYLLVGETVKDCETFTEEYITKHNVVLDEVYKYEIDKEEPYLKGIKLKERNVRVAKHLKRIAQEFEKNKETFIVRF